MGWYTLSDCHRCFLRVPEHRSGEEAPLGAYADMSMSEGHTDPPALLFQVEGSLAILHFGGLFVIIIVLWTLAPKNNAHDAFLQLTNNGGWSSNGLSMMVGLYPLTLCLLGFDSAVHMCKY